MAKVTSTGLNLVSKNINAEIKKNNFSQEKIISDKNDILKGSNLLDNNSFINNVSDALENVAQAQQDAAQVTKNFELGKEQDLTKVIVSQQISKLGFQMTLNIRNKVLSAYKDIMNMPV